MQTLAIRHTEPCGVTPPRKAVYLTGGESVRVDSDGNRLIVIASQGGKTVVPFGRIDRILCNARSDWTGRALTDCLSRGIAIVWVTPKDGPVGAASSVRPEATTLGRDIEGYVEHPEWRVRYENWLKRRRMNVFMEWAQRSINEGCGKSLRSLEEIKRQYVYRGQTDKVPLGEARAWCYALVAARLGRAGAERRYWGYDGQPLELADDLTELFYAELAFDAGNLTEGLDDALGALTFVENWLRLHGRRIDAHIGDLKRHVRSANDTWH